MLADGLAALNLCTHLAQRADLEDVGVVPTFAQGGVAEDEADRFALVEESRLVAHDKVIRVVIDLGRTGAVLELVRIATFALEHREIATSQVCWGLWE